jgi:hypothetical protein
LFSRSWFKYFRELFSTSTCLTITMYNQSYISGVYLFGVNVNPRFGTKSTLFLPKSNELTFLALYPLFSHNLLISHTHLIGILYASHRHLIRPPTVHIFRLSPVHHSPERTNIILTGCLYPKSIYSSFVKEISKSNLLKLIWENSKSFGENYYGRIFSANRKIARPSGLTLNNKITPDNIFMKTNSLVWDDNYFSLVYEIEKSSR